MFDLLEADIVVMQELKIQRKDLRDDMVLLDDWDCFFSLPRQKKGWWIGSLSHAPAIGWRGNLSSHMNTLAIFYLYTDRMQATPA